VVVERGSAEEIGEVLLSLEKMVVGFHQ